MPQKSRRTRPPEHRTILIALLAALIHVPAPAHAAAESATGAPNAATANGDFRTPRSGLEFEIGSDLTLSSFQGTLISYRSRGAHGGGWRGGIDLRGSFSDFKDEATSPDTTVRRDSESHSAAAAIVLQRLFGPPRRLGLGGYWALGPEIGYQSTFQEDQSNGPFSKVRTWNLGLASAAGVEWLTDRGISLHAEYGLVAAYNWNRSEDRNPPSFGSVRRVRAFQVSEQSVRFGLTTWFR
jgi:hypothetical protein